MTPTLKCALCGRPAAGRLQGPFASLCVCRPCALDKLPELIARALYDPAGGFTAGVATLAMIARTYWEELARLTKPAAPPVTPLHVPAADADPRLRHEVAIEWATDVDPAKLGYCRERLVRNVYGRTGRPHLRYYKLLGWGNVSPQAPPCHGMPNCFARRMFFLKREDGAQPSRKAGGGECIDPRSIRPGVFGTPIGTVKGGNHAQ